MANRVLSWMTLLNKQFGLHSDTASLASPVLHLKDDGNLVLRDLQGTVLWQSFDFPTDTLLPGQPLTRHTQLVSARSETNHSSGFYKLFFDDDNVLRLLYDGPDVSSIYWPYPWLVSWDAGRSTYNSSRFAVLDSLGRFISSDDFTFTTSDYGTMKQRRLMVTLECMHCMMSGLFRGTRELTRAISTGFVELTVRVVMILNMEGSARVFRGYRVKNLVIGLMVVNLSIVRICA
ncbi:unnamed protein product [Sphenostylis stenocarpa]|uniref:Bulb-type lectin domain-containing protein n=1 Tax=Sphenostylis stenocarpa TaxID=92480 RepID=A0AA86RTI0_9FABA|nr:unnamed protein product [Sphenostylis stenocarpa]